MPALRVWPIIPPHPNYRIKRLFLFLRFVLTVPEGPTGPNLEAVRARAWAGARASASECARCLLRTAGDPQRTGCAFHSIARFLFFFFFPQNITKHIHEEKKKKSLRLDVPPTTTPNVNNHSREPHCASEEVWNEGAFIVRVFVFLKDECYPATDFSRVSQLVWRRLKKQKNKKQKHNNWDNMLSKSSTKQCVHLAFRCQTTQFS